jgi:hypothetical protein
MALLLIVVVAWILLAGIVVVLCRAAQLGEEVAAPGRSDAERPGDRPRISGAAPRPTRHLVSVRDGPGRRPGRAPSHAGGAAFTKSLRRRAGLHRA